MTTYTLRALSYEGEALIAELVSVSDSLVGASSSTTPMTNAPGAYDFTFTGLSVTGLHILRVLDNSNPASPGGLFSLYYDLQDTFDVQYDLTTKMLLLIDDIKAKTDTLGGGSIEVVSPVSISGGEVTLVVGAAYYAVDGRSLDFSPANDGDWPNLTGATITFSISWRGLQQLEVSGAVVNPTTNKLVRVELSSANTSSLYPHQPGPQVFALEAVLADSNKVSLIPEGTVIVIGDN